jgi:hypothetical protein
MIKYASKVMSTGTWLDMFWEIVAIVSGEPADNISRVKHFSALKMEVAHLAAVRIPNIKWHVYQYGKTEIVAVL